MEIYILIDKDLENNWIEVVTASFDKEKLETELKEEYPETGIIKKIDFI
jgi:hypothetical protein